MNTDNTVRLDATRSGIDELRHAIDGIDEEILKLINMRLRNAIEIGRLKEEKGESIIDRTRENYIIERLITLNRGPLTQNALKQIFSLLIAVSREIQNKTDTAGI